MKTEVYSWRVSPDLKSSLEREARRRKVSVSKVLEMAARNWLENGTVGNDDEELQLRLHQAASKCLGAFAGGNPGRSEDARRAVRERLRRNRER